MWNFATSVFFIHLASFVSVTCCHGQINITLRNLETITTPNIRMSDDFIELPNERVLGWDQVLSADGLSAKEANRFNRLTKAEGLPLYRLRHRLKIGDWASLAEISDEWFDQIRTRIPSQNSYRKHCLIGIAAFRSHLFHGKRIKALLAFSYLCELEKRFPHQRFPVSNRIVSREALKNFFADQLAPVWFDREAAKNFIDDREVNKNRISQYSDGELIYLVSLMCCIENFDLAQLFIDELSKSNTQLSNRWHPLLLARLELDINRPGVSLTGLQKNYRKLHGSARAYANFLMAQYKAKQQEGADAAILDLLYIVANYSEALPGLSAAALNLAAKIARENGNADEANILEIELSVRFKNTYHGKRINKK